MCFSSPGGHSGSGLSRSSTIANGETSLRYSTRTRTGSVKPRRYNNDGIFTDIEDGDEDDKPSRRRGRRRHRKRIHNNKVKSQVNNDSDSDTEIDSELAQTSTRPSRCPPQGSQSPAHRKTRMSDSESEESEPQNRYLTRKLSQRKVGKNYKDSSDSDSETEEEEVSLPRKSTRAQKPVHRLAVTLNMNQNSVPHRLAVKLNVNQNNVQQQSSSQNSTSSDSDTKSDWVSEPESHSSSGTETMETECISTSVTSNLRKRKTRNQGTRNYKESSDDENISENHCNSDSATVSKDKNSSSANGVQSVSSRGRVRKATAKARALWK